MLPYEATVTGRAILITMNKRTTLTLTDLLGVVKSGTPASKAHVFIAYEAYHLTDHKYCDKHARANSIDAY